MMTRAERAPTAINGFHTGRAGALAPPSAKPAVTLDVPFFVLSFSGLAWMLVDEELEFSPPSVVKGCGALRTQFRSHDSTTTEYAVSGSRPPTRRLWDSELTLSELEFTRPEDA